MGTPGEKLPFEKVVETPETPRSTNEEEGLPPLEASDMTVLQNVPSLGIFIEPPDLTTGPQINLHTLEDLEKQLLLDTTPDNSNNSSSLVETLSAATDEFFEHSIATSSSSESTAAAFRYLPTINQSNVVTSFADLNLPGPSGLQTPKTKQEPPTTLIKTAPTKRNKNLQTPKKLYVCQVCEKNFQTSAKLQQHQLVHSGGTPFKCEHCKKSFSSKFKLVRHVLIHSDRKAFSCTVCERTFHRKDHLKNHIKVHSPSKKVYTCEKPNCKKEYTSIMSYRKHLAMHAAEEGSLECKICSKVFETKSDIMYHLKIHAGSRTVKNPNEKKFTCDYCERKFFTRKDVRRHLVVHTGTRNFLCQFCPQRFGRKDHLVRHIKKSHSRNFTEIEGESDSANVINYPQQKVKLEEMPPQLPEVQNLLFARSFTELSPMLCSEPSQLEFIATTSETALPSSLPSDTELLEELDVMKEELEGSAGPSSLLEVVEPHRGTTSLLEDQELLPEIMHSDLLRLISDQNQLSEDENNLPLPGFSQVFKQQEPPS